jgi:hypothetical protein
MPRVIEHRLGARPTRSKVRVESGRLRDGMVVAHNYKHGGDWVTPSWGCAVMWHSRSPPPFGDSATELKSGQDSR